MADPAAVRFEGVTKRYGSVTAVDDVSFTIEPGTLVTLLGPSGCGKTTTLRLIAGLELASSGRIFIGDRDVTALAASERDVSMVFQSYALFPHLSVLDNVSYGPSVSGTPRARAHEMAREKLQLVGLEALADRMPSELSGGQQQRVAVARALVLEPKVLLFDEPLSNLDAKLRRRVREEIRDLQQRLGLTVAYVTHDQEEALAVSDRIIVMSNAQIAQIGTPRELYEAPADRFVADFIGDANLVPAQIVQSDGRRMVLRAGALEVTVGYRGDLPDGAMLVLRPHSMSLADPDDPRPGLKAFVAKATYLGTHAEYTLTSALGSLFVIDQRPQGMYPAGQAVKVLVDPAAVAVVPT